jgi:nitrogen-specific signal transduction histidine kinase
LGLSIAREIAVAHGGRIGLHSKPGERCEFFVVLPLADEDSRVPSEPVSNPPLQEATAYFGDI